MYYSQKNVLVRVLFTAQKKINFRRI